MGETGVWSLGQEDPLEEGMTTHSGIFAWEIPWREEPGGLQSMGLQRVRHDWATNTLLYLVESLFVTCVPYKILATRETEAEWKGMEGHCQYFLLNFSINLKLLQKVKSNQFLKFLNK